jgi:hypothetical protein
MCHYFCECHYCFQSPVPCATIFACATISENTVYYFLHIMVYYCMGLIWISYGWTMIWVHHYLKFEHKYCIGVLLFLKIGIKTALVFDCHGLESHVRRRRRSILSPRTSVSTLSFHRILQPQKTHFWTFSAWADDNRQCMYCGRRHYQGRRDSFGVVAHRRPTEWKEMHRSYDWALTCKTAHCGRV